jgi:hypothetical protein
MEWAGLHKEELMENDSREIIKELLDRNKFQTVKVEYDTLVWENGVDFAPEYLYDKIKIEAHIVA